MSLIASIGHTPPWVWALLAFLVYRGVQALHPRTMSPARMLLLPALFFAWACQGIAGELGDALTAFSAFAGALALGGAAGWLVAARQEPARLDGRTGLIRRLGSSAVLVLICVGFAAKYALSLTLALHRDLADQTLFCALYGAVGGLVDGGFWGMTAAQVSTAYGRVESRVG